MTVQQGITKKSYVFASIKNTPANATVWEPAGKPRGIIQIAHGMAEYIDRYDDFAMFLAGEGFVVAGYNHYAHGNNVAPEDWGVFPAEGGTELLIEDYNILKLHVRKTYGEELPFFVFGHSMGSFIARANISRHPDGVTGAIICGTGHNPAAVCKFGGFLARRIMKAKGIRYRSAFLNGLADGAYSKAIPDARTPFDWLNTDPAKVDEYIADPACGFMFSCSGYVALMGLTAEVADAARVNAIPKALPVFFIAGDRDPVGGNGKGVTAVAEMFKAAGMTAVEEKLYEGMRHEILNEPEHAVVYADVLAWLEAQLPAAACETVAAPEEA